jgi:hypothetical protein
VDEAPPTFAYSAPRVRCAVSGHARALVEVRRRPRPGARLAGARLPRAEVLLPGAAERGLLPKQLGRRQDPVDRAPLPRAGADPGSPVGRPQPSSVRKRPRPGAGDAHALGRWQLAGGLAEQAFDDACESAGVLRLAGGRNDVQPHHLCSGPCSGPSRSRRLRTGTGIRPQPGIDATSQKS